ncbi:MAG TPA: ZIP family metal transporter [Candidatus Paceibacterota bacterium]|nr:ZIP family metal transporter [Candidatus Paceibacterota bacterium]HRY76836.1 ZIP family metal transporter [Candidatus Paceibacterota bacterium]
MTAIIFAIATFFSTFLGGLLGIKFKDKLHYIISFTAGVLLSVIFFDVIPEIFQLTKTYNLNIVLPMIALISGFLFIHILEKAAVLHHSHEEQYADHKHPLVGVLSASGLILHSFLDGVGIGLGFQASFQVGILITIAVLAHDFSDGLNTISLMLINKNTVKKSIVFLIIDALAPILGALSTLVFTISNKTLVLYLGFFAGFLLYIAAADLLPEAHSKHSSYKLVGLTIFGIILIFAITRLIT